MALNITKGIIIVTCIACEDIVGNAIGFELPVVINSQIVISVTLTAPHNIKIERRKQPNIFRSCAFDNKTIADMSPKNVLGIITACSIPSMIDTISFA